MSLGSPGMFIFKRSVRALHYLGFRATSSTGCHWYLISRLFLTYLATESIVVRCLGPWMNRSEITAEEICVQLIFTTLNGITILLFVNQLHHRNRADTLVGRLEMICHSKNMEDERETDLLVKTRRKTDLIGLFTPCLFAFLICVQTTVIILNISEKQPVAGGWYPYDVTSAPYLQLTVIIQALSGTFHVPALAAVSAFYMTILIHVEVQFRILQYKLRNIRAHSLAALRMTSSTAWQLSAGREDDGEMSEFEELEELNAAPVADSDLVDDLVQALERDVSRSDKQELQEVQLVEVCGGSDLGSARVRSRTSEGLMSPKELSILEITDESFGKDSVSAAYLEVEMELRLAKCIKMHEELLSVCKEINTMADKYFLGVVLFCMIPAVIGVIYCTLMASYNLRLAAYIFILFFVILLVLMLTCWLADNISEQSGLVGEAAYACDWLQASDSFKKSLRIIISSANQPFVFKAAGFLPMTMKTFENVLKTCYSYYTTLNTFADQKKHSITSK